mgnify:CR=1 FL=1
MMNWQVTATTIYCDAVDDDVTIMVYKDRTVRCAGYKRYVENKENAKALKRRAKKLGRELRCEGPECSRMIEYREKLFAEEAAAKR